ncbi:MAG: histidine triad nucleotide-binding protein [Legionellales bacterium]|nr:histidine triad nucleotide-binding protein [Legionellales bacterium]|tara:strand:+ start:894 stop:1280 length:387 start_codon:yes stop_codon:yes gene_type:complete
MLLCGSINTQIRGGYILDNCLFCRILAKEVPSDMVYEDDKIYAFRDIYPKAPTHVLVIPREHIDSFKSLEPKHASLVAHITLALPKIAESLGLEGFRTIINTGEAGGQEVFHLHYHILGNAQGKLPGF